MSPQAAPATAADVLDGAAKWALLTADAIESLRQLPSGAIHHTITDPPYSLHVHSRQRRVLRGYGPVPAPLPFPALTPATRRAVAEQLGRLTQRWCLVFSDEESAHLWRRRLSVSGLRHIRCGAWVKLAGQPQLTGDRPAVGHEAIEIAHGPARAAWNGGGLPALWAFAVATDRNGRGTRFHPTQKPLELMMALVEQFTDPGDVVLDPFAGSGTTGVACLRLGRRFIGVELEPTYAQTARERLLAEGRGLDLPDARRGQRSIFDAIDALNT